jgi:hypothetical protein
MKKIFALVAAVFLSMSQPYANDCVLYSYTQEKSAYTPGKYNQQKSLRHAEGFFVDYGMY